MKKIVIQVFFIFGFGLLLSGCNYPGALASQNQSGTMTPIERTAPSPTFMRATPTVENIPTITVIPTPGLLTAQKVAVVFVSEGNELEIRSRPGADQAVIANISPHAQNITLSKAFEWQDDHELWVEITTADGISGWVDAYYLTNQISSDAFCMDKRVTSLMAQFIDAVKERNGEKFFELVSPLHGLFIRHEWWNPEIQIKDPEQIMNIFTSATSYDWGIQDGNGLEISGSFQDVILPLLSEVVDNSPRSCNTLEQGLASGGSTGFIQWPFEYANLNYIALYRSAPAGDELNWRTWAVGIEFIGNKAYIVALVQYHWEI